MPGAFCAGKGSGANQPSCGYEFAIIARAASPYDCQAKVAATPMQKVIRRRMSASRARLTDELTGNVSADNSDCVVLGRALISTSHSCSQWCGLGLFIFQVPNRDRVCRNSGWPSAEGSECAEANDLPIATRIISIPRG